MQELKTRDIVEFILYRNIKNIKSRKILLIGIGLTLVIEYLFFKNFNMFFSNIIIVDYIVNIIIFSLVYMSLTSLLMHIHIIRVELFINLNVDILLKDVDLDNLQNTYESSLKKSIKDDELLKYLQNFKK